MWASTTNPNVPVTDMEQNKAVKKLYKLSYMASVVHAMRKGGTRQLQEAGCGPCLSLCCGCTGWIGELIINHHPVQCLFFCRLGIDTIAQMGMWLNNALVSFPPAAMLAMDGWPESGRCKGGFRVCAYCEVPDASQF